MKNNTKFRPLVTAKEAVELSMYYNYFISALNFADDVRDELKRTEDKQMRKEPHWYEALFYVSLFNAGRVQGIREERAKRCRKELFL